MTRLVIALMVLAGTTAARADDQLAGRLDTVAKKVAAYLKVRNESKTVVTFTGPATLQGNGLGGLEQIFAEKLSKLGITSAARANLAVKGALKSNKLTGMVLNITVVDDADEPQLDESFDFGTSIMAEEFGRIGGHSFDISGGKRDDFNRDDKINNQIRKPDLQLLASRVRPTPSSQFAMEILITDKPLSPVLKDGLAFVPIDFQQEYIVKIYNDSVREVAAELFVDGLNTFHFSKEKKPNSDRSLYQYWIIPPRQSVEVPGYYITSKQARGFKVAPAEESLAAKLGRRDKVGIITADFKNCWQQGMAPPGDEPPGFDDSKLVVKNVVEDLKDKAGRKFQVIVPQFQVMTGAPANAAGTTFGSDKVTNLSGVTRSIGVTQASVTIRYDRPAK